MPKDLYVQCDKCTGINCDEENDDTCGVCQGSQESECHQCGGAGRVQDIVVKDVTKTEPQPSADGEDEEINEITEQEEEIIEGECELCRGEGRIQCEACNGQSGFFKSRFYFNFESVTITAFHRIDLGQKITIS